MFRIGAIEQWQEIANYKQERDAAAARSSLLSLGEQRDDFELLANLFNGDSLIIVDMFYASQQDISTVNQETCG